MDSKTTETIKRCIVQLEEINKDVFQILYSPALNEDERKDMIDAHMCLTQTITELKYIDKPNE